MAIQPLLLVGILVGLLATDFLLIRMMVKYRRLTRGMKNTKMQDLLEYATEELKTQKTETEMLKTWIKTLEDDGHLHIQKIGFLRFNPFTDTGGNQSFCLALLDRHENGVVISSLHSREHTRIYAKAIKEGKALGQELSKEEKQAIIRARASGATNQR